MPVNLSEKDVSHEQEIYNAEYYRLQSSQEEVTVEDLAVADAALALFPSMIQDCLALDPSLRPSMHRIHSLVMSMPVPVRRARKND